MKYCLAIDIGASSGRHIVGYKENNEIISEEVYRFNNHTKEEDGHLIWDIDSLLNDVKKGIDEALNKYPNIESLSIDTWGVDYVLMEGDKEILPAYAYRDSRTREAIKEVHKLIPFEELYSRTGIQFQPFNTIYQLYADKLENRLDKATDFLLMPEYLMYKLCGNKAHEYTNASTGGILNAVSHEYDEEIIKGLNLKKELFNKLDQPKKCIGEYKGIKVILCATHDTASAVEGIPMEGDELYLSSGTWSLLGVKTEKAITDINSMKANYSNEGGVGYNRYQKNIMGMWLINQLREELCPDTSFKEIVEMAKNSSFEEVVNANDEVFMAPKSMKEAFDLKLNNKNLNTADYFRCAYKSLAKSYKEAIEELEANTHKKYKDLYIVGGGAKNAFLNELCKEYTSKNIIALPIEATAIGNLKIQLED